jgi:hypothetical protein
MKAVKAHLQETSPDRVAEFEKGAQVFAKKIVGNFKDYEFYVGESMNPDGMVALLVSRPTVVLSSNMMSLSDHVRTLANRSQNYREDGVTP